MKEYHKAELRAALLRGDMKRALFFQMQLDEKYQSDLRQYYDFVDKVEQQYSTVHNMGAWSGPNANRLELLCKRNIGMAEGLKDRWVKYKQPLPRIPAYQRLAMLYEKQEKYFDAANICMIAIQDGFSKDSTNSGMRGRLARMVKKGKLQATPEMLRELSKLT